MFASLTAEMEKLSGQVYIADPDEGFAYVTQDPWIQHLSIRDNILFGKEFNDEWYFYLLICFCPQIIAIFG